MQLEKERFEAWLLNRPDNEEYCAISPLDCLIHRFITQTTNRRVGVGGNHFSLYSDNLNSENIPFPPWLSETWEKSIARNSRVGPVKEYWRKRWLEKEEKEAEPATAENPAQPKKQLADLVLVGVLCVGYVISILAACLI